MFLTIVVLALAFIMLLYFVKVYNALVSLKNNVAKSWSNIDVLLKQRHDEIPKLIDVCSGYMKFEKDTLEAVMKARTAAFSSKDVGDASRSEGQLTAALGRLFAVSERYPELKANENFSHLRTRISDLESQISDRREFYNDSVNIYNIRIQQIPDSFVASFLSYAPAQLFQIAPEDREDVKIKFSAP